MRSGDVCVQIHPTIFKLIGQLFTSQVKWKIPTQKSKMLSNCKPLWNRWSVCFYAIWRLVFVLRCLCSALDMSRLFVRLFTFTSLRPALFFIPSLTARSRKVKVFSYEDETGFLEEWLMWSNTYISPFLLLYRTKTCPLISTFSWFVDLVKCQFKAAQHCLLPVIYFLTFWET